LTEAERKKLEADLVTLRDRQERKISHPGEKMSHPLEKRTPSNSANAKVTDEPANRSNESIAMAARRPWADTRRVLDISVRMCSALDHCVAISTPPRTDLDAFDTYEAAKTAILSAYNDVMFRHR
jgi:hypothetical protein